MSTTTRRLSLPVKVLAVVVLFVLWASAQILKAMAFGWIWACRVLAGKQRLGPRNMWYDEKARREFGVRATELQMAWSIIIAYTCLLIVAILHISPDSYSPSFDTGRLIIFTAAWSTMFLCIIHIVYLQEKWESTSRQLSMRWRTPTLDL